MDLKIFSNTNIEEQLKQIRSNDLNELFSKNDLSQNELNQFNIDDLERDRIFHIEDIKKTCIDYRLRFWIHVTLKTKYLRLLLMK